MNTQEAAALLGIAAAFDNRKPDADAAQAWAIALDGLRFNDARDAIVAHYRTSSDWLMPQKVIAGVKRIRNQRLTDYGPLVPPSSLDPDDTLALTRWHRDATRAVADGNPPPKQTPVAGIAPASVRRDLLELRRKAQRDVREGLDDGEESA